MRLFLFLPFIAGLSSLVLAVVSLIRRKPSAATWCFFAGMTALGIDSIVTALALRSIQLRELIYWLTAAFIVKSLIPVIWLCFSLTYSRADSREALTRWRIPLIGVALLPVALSLSVRDQLFQVVPLGTEGNVWRLQFGGIANALNVIHLVVLVLILMNMEQTFRSAVGTMRWRLKLWCLPW
jgi:hypothetical protein